MDVAGDGARRVAHEKRAQRADVVDLDLALQRRAAARLGEELVELRECRTPRVSCIGPGDTAFTRIPLGPSSVAR